MAEIGVPSVRGVQNALFAYGAGAVGGIVYNAAAQMIGNGLIGGAVAAALAGSVVRGSTGDAIAAVAGFQSGLGLLGQLGGGGGGGGSTANVI